MGTKYHHLTWSDRLIIEKCLNQQYKPKEIARLIGVHVSTIYREMQRGIYEHLNSDYTYTTKYSPDIAETAYQFNLSAKGSSFKIGANYEATKFIENLLLDGYSPNAVCIFLRQHPEFNITLCRQTVYKYIDDGNIFPNVTNEHLPERTKREQHRATKPRQKRANAGKNIEQRPEAVDERREQGHWEMDTVLGKKRTKARLLVLTERVTRKEIIIRIKDGTAKSVVQALDRLERFYGKHFKTIFKSITVDNGSEFSDNDGMERSCTHKGNRTTVYYCHPFTASERGSNENLNKMIRRKFPKGTNFDKVKQREVKQVEAWLNSYPRNILGGRSADQAFKEAFPFVT